MCKGFCGKNSMSVYSQTYLNSVTKIGSVSIYVPKTPKEKSRNNNFIMFEL